MIIYFSATGNSKYVAERIASAINDRAMSIEDGCYDITLSEGECLGIVVPAHFWALPIPMKDYLNKMKLHRRGKHYIFTVSTYGSTAACSGEEARRLLRENNIRLSAAFSVKMPDTWTVTFDLSDLAKVARKNEKAEKNIDKVIAMILDRKKGNFISLKTPYFMYPLAMKLFDKARMTKNLSVDENCIGCGLCAAKCPVRAIEMRGGKPVWVKERCALCFRCLHNCPKFSIQLWNGMTRKHGQYTNPNVKV